jgi:murein DD-endopeptidase MepM/ murein hydrolase activator NlpD
VVSKAPQKYLHRLNSLTILALFFICVLAPHAASASEGKECQAIPSTLSLGGTFRLRCSIPVSTATFQGRSVRLFQQSNGIWFGLMPVAVADKPGQFAIEFLDPGGGSLRSVPVKIIDPHFPSQDVILSPEIEGLHSSPEEIKTLTSFRDAVSDTRFWVDPLFLPVPGCMKSPFGVKRLHNGKPTSEFHGGVDQRAADGAPIRAAAAGTIEIAQKFTVLGGTVGIDHGQGLETMYLHMSKLEVEPGARVNRGDVIGYAGATGRANGPHLHWVIYVNGVPVNPAQWVKLKSCETSSKK